MNIEQLIPQMRSGAKVRLKGWPKSDYVYFVEDYIAADHHEFGDTEPYTGFIYYAKGNFWFSEVGGEQMLLGEWELYDV